jgi:hypothetical protein
VHGSGRSAGRDGVDDDGEIGAGPGVQKTRRLLLDDDYLEAGLVAQALRDGYADAVVAAINVSDADRDDPQSRSTSRLRKCVAQEMQGS